MARTKISEFSATPSLNTDIDGINIAEGCPPSGINDAIRELMAQLKDQQTGASGDPFTVGGNLSVTGTTTLTGALTATGGSINGTAIGGTTAAAGSFTTLAASGNATVGGTLAVTGAATLTANPTLSAGTANGVAYLNGSKVVTSGADLTFDGTNLGIGTSVINFASGTGAVLYGATDTRFVLKNATSGTGAYSGFEMAINNTTGAGQFTQWQQQPILFLTNNGSSVSERMRLDAAGNLGLGVVPSAWGVKALEIAGPAFVGSSGTALTTSTNGVFSGTAWSYKTSAAATAYGQNSGNHYWYTAPSGTAGDAISFTQPMTLDASGNLLVGTTTSYSARVNILTPVSAGIGFAVQAGADGQYAGYFRNSAGTNVGNITINTTGTAYNTSSDYRLKEDVQPMTGALVRVAALKPVTYKWKVDGSDGEGFIAHELQAVVPQCVTGEKDAVETYTDEDGVEQTRPVYQGIDTSFLVATLTAAIQEQQALIESLTARIAALEGVQP